MTVENKKRIYIKLKPAWQKHFEGLRFDRNLSKNKNRYHELYNKKLREYLLECQKKGFLPSKDHMTEKCHVFQDEVKFIISLNGVDEKRLDPERIDLALSSMDYLEIILSHNDAGEPYPYDARCLKVFGIVHLKGLTIGERKWIDECFSSIGEFEGDCYRLTLMSVIFSSDINEEKKDKINGYICRVARDKFKNYMNSLGLDTKFKYSFFDKIKDKWLDGGI